MSENQHEDRQGRPQQGGDDQEHAHERRHEKNIEERLQRHEEREQRLEEKDRKLEREQERLGGDSADQTAGRGGGDHRHEHEHDGGRRHEHDHRHEGEHQHQHDDESRRDGSGADDTAEDVAGLQQRP